MRERIEPTADELDLSAVMHALADPSRLRMVVALDGTEELSCTELGVKAGTAAAKSTTSHHMSVLSDAGLIATRPEGQKKLASLRRSTLDSRFPGLLDAVIAGVSESA